MPATGGGWGGLAERLMDRCDCAVTGVTLSTEQLAFAQKRLRNRSRSGHCDLRLQDYRHVRGTFDHIVSIEMLEAVGAVDVLDRPFQGDLMRIYGAIPVHRGEYDRVLIDTMLAILRSGRPLMIAPEGGRSHGAGLRRAMPGVAYILDEARVPVLPVGLVGTTDDVLKRSLRFDIPLLEMRIGEPFHLPPIEGVGAVRREARQRNADLVMKHIAHLLPIGDRGIYT